MSHLRLGWQWIWGWTRQQVSSHKLKTSPDASLDLLKCPNTWPKPWGSVSKSSSEIALTWAIFEDELSTLYLLRKKNVLTKQRKATTSVELHRQFTFERDWILKGPSELLNLFAGLILFSFIFRIIAIWFLTELMLS